MTAKSTVKVNGGAMPKFNRRAITARAWEIFRDVYHCPRIKLSSIGWKCFGWALKQAWFEARQVARLFVTRYAKWDILVAYRKPMQGP